MGNIFKPFYRNFYSRTGGYVPAVPLSQAVYPGDFFQIQQGEIVIIGNIFRNGVVVPENVMIENGVKLNGASWSFNEGVTKAYTGRGSEQASSSDRNDFNKQILAFDEKGSFIFEGKNPESIRINNWNDIASELIIKLSQTFYSFREVYVVTESVTTSTWTLAISGSDKGTLELGCDDENLDSFSIFGTPASKTIQARDLEYYNQEDKRIPTFFKAKKLAVQEGRMEDFVSQLIQNKSGRDSWAYRFFEADLHQEIYPNINYNLNINRTTVLDMLQANQLNPNTALLYFEWVNMGLDEVDQLF